MKKYIVTIVLSLTALATVAQQKIQYQLCGQDFRPLYMHDSLPAGAVYENKQASPEARAADVLGRLSFEEKLTLTGGWKSMHFPGVPELGLPPVYFSDASQGVHVKNICVKVGQSTAFPSELALAATWNPPLAYQYARDIGEECQAWGINVLLGPGLNMYRNAEGGRSFEYMGEDPFLTAAMAVSYVKGLQSTGTMATLKHFIVNDQEFVRHIVNVKAGERALHEIYLRPFEACIKKGGALAVMTGNNFVNGYPGAADKPLSEGILRHKDGFEGIIMSDWANSMFWPQRLGMVLGSGQSLLMSNNKAFALYIHQLIKADPAKKKIIERGLDSMVYHNLFAFFKSGVYDRPYRNPALVDEIGKHKKTALETAEQGITLLKNDDGILPVRPGDGKKIVILGTEEALHVYTGTGSGRVIGYDQVDYLKGLQDVYGTQIIHHPDITDEEIRSADVVFYFINKRAGEGYDVPYNMPDINEKIARYAALNKNIAIVYSGGNGLAMPWLSQVKALVFAFLPGQEGGVALANILSGRVNPSGRLPFTIEKSFAQSPAYDYNKMPDGHYYWGGGKPDGKKMAEKFGKVEIDYKEGIYIGYRWYDKKNITPQFPFGYGLSYSPFQFSKIRVSSRTISKNAPVTIRFTMKNTGKMDGAEVAQLYVYPPSGVVDRPVKELKGFKKVFLKAGERQTIQLTVKLEDLAYWSPQTHQWEVDHGKYVLALGKSSRDILSHVLITY